MTESDALEALREATATIRGYIYQFDASILAVLAATDGQDVTVEGVEDFDILSSDTDTYGQVKYYEAQKLTGSTLRDAIVPMLEGYLRYPAEVRSRKRYILYGHFKQAAETAPTILLADLQRILVQRPYKVDDATGEKARTVVNRGGFRWLLDKQKGVQGSQFTSMAFTAVLHREKIAISMDGRGAWRDNVFVERLWSSVKYEEVYLRAYGSVSEARASIGRYLTFYNGRRPHSSLDRRTPDHVYFNRPLLAAA